MRRLRLLAAVLLPFAAALFSALAMAGSAQASVQVGACQLYADKPWIGYYGGSNHTTGQGGINNCSGNYSSVATTTCLENNSGSGWGPTYDCSYSGKQSPPLFSTSYAGASVCGVWYRTWIGGQVWNTFGGSEGTNATVGDADYRC